eukprot:PhM_4_TR17551/c0_g1_i1/m.72346
MCSYFFISCLSLIFSMKILFCVSLEEDALDWPLSCRVVRAILEQILETCAVFFGQLTRFELAGMCRLQPRVDIVRIFCPSAFVAVSGIHVVLPKPFRACCRLALPFGWVALGPLRRVLALVVCVVVRFRRGLRRGCLGHYHSRRARHAVRDSGSIFLRKLPAHDRGAAQPRVGDDVAEVVTRLHLDLQHTADKVTDLLARFTEILCGELERAALWVARRCAAEHNVQHHAKGPNIDELAVALRLAVRLEHLGCKVRGRAAHGRHHAVVAAILGQTEIRYFERDGLDGNARGVDLVVLRRAFDSFSNVQKDVLGLKIAMRDAAVVQIQQGLDELDE